MSVRAVPVAAAAEGMASWVAGPREGPGPVDAADVGSVADCKAEIARLQNEVHRLSALVAQKDELLAHADRIHLKLHAELQAHARKQRGEKKPRRIPGDPQQASHTTSAVAGSHARDAMQTQDREPGQQPSSMPPVETAAGNAAPEKRQRADGAQRSGWCHHNRQRSRCVECGGSGICVHKRVARNCKECGGSNLCVPHKRPKSRCVDCGGSSTCEHKKLRRYCIECGGVGICVHKRIRRDCKECKGSAICAHNKHRSACKECNCRHGVPRGTCSECSGASKRKRSRVSQEPVPATPSGGHGAASAGDLVADKAPSTCSSALQRMPPPSSATNNMSASGHGIGGAVVSGPELPGARPTSAAAGGSCPGQN